jgi:hypothetical protein
MLVCGERDLNQEFQLFLGQEVLASSLSASRGLRAFEGSYVQRSLMNIAK